MESCCFLQVLRHMCEGLVALLMDRADYNKYMMRSVARDLLASLVFRPMMQHLTPYNINKVLPWDMLNPQTARVSCICGFVVHTSMCHVVLHYTAVACLHAQTHCHMRSLAVSTCSIALPPPHHWPSRSLDPGMSARACASGGCISQSM